jgi:hypothetical protein
MRVSTRRPFCAKFTNRTMTVLEIASGEREGEISSLSPEEHTDDDLSIEDMNEESELLEEITACITRLFRVSSVIRRAAPTDLFAKALSKNRVQFNDQFDIAHVSEKFPKLMSHESQWLQRRLGRAITQRRQYLSYIQHHREKLGTSQNESAEMPVPKPQALPITQLHPVKPSFESMSRPSTYLTKATTIAPNFISSQMLTATAEESDPDDDARSYTTISRSIDGEHESSTMARIPKLVDLRVGAKKEFECPFCFRMKKFKNERVWRRHIFSDLRSYVCTFPDCDAPLFGDINEWFRHEMQNHRVCYTCRLCKEKTFFGQDRFLGHVRRQHPDLLESGDEGPLLNISRRSVDHIPARDCPCCYDWVDRLQEREVGHDHIKGSDIIAVPSPIFKRHLAAHLEQLALFAIAIGSTSGDSVESNMAVEVANSVASRHSKRSTLTFESNRFSTNPRLSDNGTLSRSTSVVSAASSGVEDPIACEICSELFGGEYRRETLATHKRHMHGNEESDHYFCEEPGCQRKFKRQAARSRHYRRHHPHLYPYFFFTTRELWLIRKTLKQWSQKVGLQLHFTSDPSRYRYFLGDTIPNGSIPGPYTVTCVVNKEFPEIDDLNADCWWGLRERHTIDISIDEGLGPQGGHIVMLKSQFDVSNVIAARKEIEELNSVFESVKDTDEGRQVINTLGDLMYIAEASRRGTIISQDLEDWHIRHVHNSFGRIEILVDDNVPGTLATIDHLRMIIEGRIRARRLEFIKEKPWLFTNCRYVQSEGCFSIYSWSQSWRFLRPVDRVRRALWTIQSWRQFVWKKRRVSERPRKILLGKSPEPQHSYDSVVDRDGTRPVTSINDSEIESKLTSLSASYKKSQGQMLVDSDDSDKSSGPVIMRRRSDSRSAVDAAHGDTKLVQRDKNEIDGRVESELEDDSNDLSSRIATNWARVHVDSENKPIDVQDLPNMSTSNDGRQPVDQSRPRTPVPYPPVGESAPLRATHGNDVNEYSVSERVSPPSSERNFDMPEYESTRADMDTT